MQKSTTAVHRRWTSASAHMSTVQLQYWIFHIYIIPSTHPIFLFLSIHRHLWEICAKLSLLVTRIRFFFSFTLSINLFGSCENHAVIHKFFYWRSESRTKYPRCVHACINVCVCVCVLLISWWNIYFGGTCIIFSRCLLGQLLLQTMVTFSLLENTSN